MLGAWCFDFCQAHPSLPVGFLFLLYSVSYTVESLYCFFISSFICFGDVSLIRKGSFMQTKHLLVLIYIWTKGEVEPSSKICLLTVPRRYIFCGSFVFFVSCVSHNFASVHCCWERGYLLALVCDVYCISVTFPCHILGQLWYLIVSFPDLCLLSHFNITRVSPTNQN